MSIEKVNGSGANMISLNGTEVVNLNEEKSSKLIAGWYNAILEGNVSVLRNSIEQGIKMMADGITNGQYENLHFLFHSSSDKIEALGNLLDIDSNPEYAKVFTYAIFWAMDRISNKLYNSYLLEKNIQNKCDELKILQNSKYFHQMLALLEKNGELSQGAIARNLSISTNALSNFLRRNEKYELWEYKRYGRYNYYHLTAQGKDYLASYQQKKLMKDKDTISSILRSFMDCLVDEIEAPNPKVENISHKINKKFGNGQVIFGSESDKLAMNKTIRRIHCHVKRKERQNSLGFDVFRGFEEYFDVAETFSYIHDLGEEDYHIEPIDYRAVSMGGMA